MFKAVLFAFSALAYLFIANEGLQSASDWLSGWAGESAKPSLRHRRDLLLIPQPNRDLLDVNSVDGFRSVRDLNHPAA